LEQAPVCEEPIRCVTEQARDSALSFLSLL
jgi:hypothetical protein